MRKDSQNKSLRRRLIAFAVVAGLLLLVFLVRLVQFQFFPAQGIYAEAQSGGQSQSASVGQVPGAAASVMPWQHR